MAHQQYSLRLTVDKFQLIQYSYWLNWVSCAKNIQCYSRP